MADKLKSLIEEFRKFDKESVIKNFETEDEDENSKLYDKIYSNLENILARWNGIEKVEENDLMKIALYLNLIKLLKDSSSSVLSVVYLRELEHVSTKIMSDLCTENFASVIIGDKTFGKCVLNILTNLFLDIIRLAPLPRLILFLAGEKLQSCSDLVQSAYLRRIIQNAMVGGIAAQLLNRVTDFKFRSKNLESCSLPLDSNTLSDEIQGMNLVSQHFKIFRSYYPSKYSSEFRLRFLLWDNLINILVTEGEDKALPIDIIPELNVAPLLGLEKEVRRVDFVLLSTGFDLPFFFIEYALEESEGSFGHKDCTKLSSLMTICCNRLCQKLQNSGSDPSIAKVFGMLVGCTKAQLLVAHPVIKDSTDGYYSEIHIIITSHAHWFMDLLKDKGLSLDCQNNKCCHSPPRTVTLHPPENLIDLNEFPYKQVKRIKLNSDSVSEDEFHSKDEIYNPDNTVKITTERELNLNSLKKIDSFIKCSKGFIEELTEDNLKLNPNKFKPIKFPNVAHVPRSRSSNLGFTPDPSKVKTVENKTLEATKKNLFKDSSSFHKTKRNLSFEYQLYSEYFRNSRLFPEMLSCEITHQSKTVIYTFEMMTEFLGGGSLGLVKENGRFFGPKIRDQHPCFVILEATIFALHVLYGLYVLHEEFGIVHGDISPSNIMFSEIDDIWKLNDFETAMLLENSLKTKRSIGTSGYICPVSQENGIYDKASDIYSLGKVLWSTFVMKLICEVDVFDDDDLPEGTHEAVDEFMNIVREMIKPTPTDRPCAKQLLLRFYTFMQKYIIPSDFYIYGSKLMIPRIEKYMFDHENKITEIDDDIALSKICINE
jgi:hypothetical protein